MDGACREGGLIKGSEGGWLDGFAKFVGHGNAYLAELWGVFEGLTHARRLNFTHVELNVDSLVVVKVITSNGCGSMIGRFLSKRLEA
ncbi:ribonuclease H protein [Trifolium medium]|uniref:Ribonuclease H protein n=1 Tax=Trifolium medium TaxID=97028 RepID=A0A392NAS4_9FABA|nr:ribonuclease H protein [Trifolium medium]